MIAGNYVEMEREGEDEEDRSSSSSSMKGKLSRLFWHGGSVYDAWFSCASNQVAQVLLTLPYSFSQLGMLSGIIFQLFYGLMGSWTAYLICVLYIEYRTRKEREKVDFRNHVIQVLIIQLMIMLYIYIYILHHPIHITEYMCSGLKFLMDY